MSYEKLRPWGGGKKHVAPRKIQKKNLDKTVEISAMVRTMEKSKAVANSKKG